MNDLKTSAPPAITPIGKREAQAWLVKRLGYERLLASLRQGTRGEADPRARAGRGSLTR